MPHRHCRTALGRLATFGKVAIVGHLHHAPVTRQEGGPHAVAGRLALHRGAVAPQLGHQRGLALGLGGALVVEHPPAGPPGRVVAAHQAVDAQALPLVAQRCFVDGGVHQRSVPGPGALACQDALRGLGGGARRAHGDVEILRQPRHAGRGPAVGTQHGQRRTGNTRLLEQLVHGLAQARRGGGHRQCRIGGPRTGIGLCAVGASPGCAAQFGGRSGGHSEGRVGGQHGQFGQREVVVRAIGHRGSAVPCGGHSPSRQLCVGQQRRQPVPPAPRRRNAGRHGRQRQAMLGAGHGHVEHVEFFALAGLLFSGQGHLGAGRRTGFAGQKDKACGLGLFARPVHQHTHGFGLLRAGVGVEQQHAARFQPLGAVHGEQAHRLRIHPAGRAHAAFFHGAHKGIGREVAPAVVLQRGREQRAQIGQHRHALRGGRSGGKAGQYVGVLVDGVQRIVRRQSVHPGLVSDQIGRWCLQCNR